MNFKYYTLLNRKIIFAVLLMTLNCISCEQKYILHDSDIVGTWKLENEGSLFLFKSDGSFEAHELYSNTIFLPDKRNVKCNGKGIWNLIEGQTGMEVDLFFQSTSCEHNGYKMQLLIQREGMFDNGKIMYLFLWIEEEGGSVYKFLKIR
jgi:hypothetical protein